MKRKVERQKKTWSIYSCRYIYTLLVFEWKEMETRSSGINKILFHSSSIRISIEYTTYLFIFTLRHFKCVYLPNRHHWPSILISWSFEHLWKVWKYGIFFRLSFSSAQCTYVRSIVNSFHCQLLHKRKCENYENVRWFMDLMAINTYRNLRNRRHSIGMRFSQKIIRFIWYWYFLWK